MVTTAIELKDRPDEMGEIVSIETQPTKWGPMRFVTDDMGELWIDGPAGSPADHHHFWRRRSDMAFAQGY